MTDQAKGILAVIAVAAGSVFVALAVRWALRSLSRRLEGRPQSWLNEVLVRHLQTPITLAIVTFGCQAAVLMLLYLNIVGLSEASVSGYIGKANTLFKALFTIIGAYGISALLSGSARWYGANAHSHDVLAQVRVLRKLATVTVWTLAVVIVLSQFGYRISTLLAALGVAGLAVALAVQDILANLFAGFYIVADRSIRTGDYIRLDSGQEGFVDEVSWRNTRVRGWDNNMIIIPNAKLIKSVLTNYDLPRKELSVNVDCGVSYDSDLEEVEKATLAVARETLINTPGAVRDFEPVLRYKEFGESNINFVVVLRAADASAQFLIRHEFIKRLHSRYKEESITISYPVRVVLSENDSRESPRA